MTQAEAFHDTNLYIEISISDIDFSRNRKTWRRRRYNARQIHHPARPHPAGLSLPRPARCHCAAPTVDAEAISLQPIDHAYVTERAV
jgi:hypothetical protein